MNRMSLSFTLRFPFELAPGWEISGLGNPIERRLEGLTLRLERQGRMHVLVVDSFDSEASAKAYASRIWAGLMWVALNRGVGFTASLDFDQVTFAADPDAAAANLSQAFGLAVDGGVDGLVDSRRPAVYPSGKRIRFLSGGDATLTVGTAFETVYGLLVEGLSLPGGPLLVSDSRLGTALELYRAHYYERSANARLLTLVMALEALTEGELKPQCALDLLTRWQHDLETLDSTFAAETEEREAIEALRRELIFRRTKSLRGQVRRLVLSSLEATDAPNAKALAQEAVKVYDMRSTLVHEGRLSPEDLRWAETHAKQIVETVLKALVVTHADEQPPPT